MKIRLIEPEPPGMHVYAKVLLPRLGLPIIAADAQGARPRRAHLQPADGAHRLGRRATAPTSSASRARRPRRRPPTSSPTTCAPAASRWSSAASHVTFMADEALEHVDYVARGEGGEQLMLELIEALAGARELDDRRRPLVHARRRGRAQPAARALRRPRRAARSPTSACWSGSEKLTTMPIMTSWGCPFACNFCSVTAMFGRKYRFRSAESVIAEIKDKRPQRIFFYDDNMAADKKRLKKLLQMMIDEDLVIPWSAQVRTDVVRDRELLELMRRSGCELVYLGLESVNQATLDGYEKSQTVDDIVEGIRLLHEYGIRSHGMFVLGADTDDVQTVRDTVTFAIKNQHRHGDAQHPHAAARHAAVRGARRRGPHLRQALGALRRPPRRVRAQAHDALRAADARTCAATCASTRCAPGCATSSPSSSPSSCSSTVGHGDHPQLAQGRAQQGLHQGAQAHVAAPDAARHRAPSASATRAQTVVSRPRPHDRSRRTPSDRTRRRDGCQDRRRVLRSRT